MRKIVPLQILILFIQECITQFMVYPPYISKELQTYKVNYDNYDWRNNVHKSKRRRKHKKYITDYKDFSDPDNCGSCSCNECYTKPCCKTMCNRCKSLIFLPYPVPYRVPEMFTGADAVSTDTEKNNEVTKEAVTETLTAKTNVTPTTTFETTEAVSTATITTEASLPLTLSTRPILVSTQHKRFEYKQCPYFPVGSCLLRKTAHRDASKHFTDARRLFSSHYLIGRTLMKKADANAMPTTKTYWFPLKDIIPIPNEMAEEILANVQKI